MWAVQGKGIRVTSFTWVLKYEVALLPLLCNPWFIFTVLHLLAPYSACYMEHFSLSRYRVKPSSSRGARTSQAPSFPCCEFPTLGYCLCKVSKDSIVAASSTLCCASLQNQTNEHYIVLGKQAIGRCLRRRLLWLLDYVISRCLTLWKLQRDKDWHRLRCTSSGEVLAVLWSTCRLQAVSCSVCSVSGIMKSADFWGRDPECCLCSVTLSLES